MDNQSGDGGHAGRTAGDPATAPAWTPSSLPPSSLPPRSLPPTAWTPASLTPVSLAPGSLPPGSVQPHSLPPRSLTPGAPLGTPPGGPARGWLVPGVALLTALVLGVVAGLVWNASRPRVTPGSAAAQAVQRWAVAVAEGRAHEALALSAALPDGDRSFLTDEVLAAARTAHPITDVRVVPRDDTSATLTWSVDGQDVSQVVPVTPGAEPRIARAAAQVSFATVAKTAPVRLVGRQVAAPTILLLPGTYPLASASPHLTYGDGTLRVTVDQPRVDTTGLVPAATEEGVATFSAVLRAGLDDCLRQKVLAPVGCPFSYAPDPADGLDPASTTWSLPGGLGALPALDVSDPTAARAQVPATLVVSGTSKTGAFRKEVPVVLKPTMNLTLAKPALVWG